MIAQIATMAAKSAVDEILERRQEEELPDAEMA